MQELCRYHIEIRGKFDQNYFNRTAPYRIAEVHGNPDSTRLVIHADQAGLIGLVRYLHQQGFVLLGVQREE